MSFCVGFRAIAVGEDSRYNLGMPVEVDMTVRLYTDFDGPLVDVAERYYRVYLECCERVPSDTPKLPLSKNAFWELKRAQVPEREIAWRSGFQRPEQTAEFVRWRQALVHSAPFLVYDRPWPTAIAALEEAVAAGIDLAIVTMRRHRELLPAVAGYGLGHLFREDRRFCLADDYQKAGDTLDKPQLLRRAVTQLPPCTQAWMVGDTEADILAAKRNNIPSIAVTCGIRNETQLGLHHPEYIVRDLREAIALILQSAPS
ncbi:MAG: HAD family hydrolase [Pseudanabaenaceae cyanobacterium]